jgi:hypothetical protein
LWCRPSSSASKLALEAEQVEKATLAEVLARERDLANLGERRRRREAVAREEKAEGSASLQQEGAGMAAETERAVKNELDGRVATALATLTSLAAGPGAGAGAGAGAGGGFLLPREALEAIQEEHSRRLALEARLEAALEAAAGGAAGLLSGDG